jgi:hypothetical protein
VTAAVELPTVTATSAAENRAVGRVVELASGLLMLLDEHGITGRLPLDARAQASRLRHAVKLAVQTAAAKSSGPPPWPLAPASPDPAVQLREWIAAQPWAQPDPGPPGFVYLLCFRDPATGQHRPLRGKGCRGQYAGHYWGKAASSGSLTALWRVNGSEFAELTLVALLRSRGSRPCRRGVCCQLLELVPQVVLPNGALHGDATPGGQSHPGGRQRAARSRHGRSARQPRANRARTAQQHPVADRPRDPAWCPLGDIAPVLRLGGDHSRHERQPHPTPRVGRPEPPGHPHAQQHQQLERQEDQPPPLTPRCRRGPRRHRIRVGLACTLSHSTLFVWLASAPYRGCSAPPTTHARRSTGRRQAKDGLA